MPGSWKAEAAAMSSSAWKARAGRAGWVGEWGTLRAHPVTVGSSFHTCRGPPRALQLPGGVWLSSCWRRWLLRRDSRHRRWGLCGEAILELPFALTAARLSLLPPLHVHLSFLTGCPADFRLHQQMQKQAPPVAHVSSSHNYIRSEPVINPSNAPPGGWLSSLIKALHKPCPPIVKPCSSVPIDKKAVLCGVQQVSGER